MFKTATSQWKFDLGFRLGNLESNTDGETAQTNIGIDVKVKTVRPEA